MAHVTNRLQKDEEWQRLLLGDWTRINICSEYYDYCYYFRASSMSFGCAGYRQQCMIGYHSCVYVIMQFVFCDLWLYVVVTLQWRHNGYDSVSNHQPHDCLLNRLFRRRSTKTPKLRVTGFCEGNSSVTGEFPAQMASNAENVSIWWRHHEMNVLAYLNHTYYHLVPLFYFFP